MEQETPLLDYVLQVCKEEHQQQITELIHDAWRWIASRAIDSYCEDEGDDYGF